MSVPTPPSDERSLAQQLARDVPPAPPSTRRLGGREIAIAALATVCLVTVVVATLRLPPPDVRATIAQVSALQVTHSDPTSLAAAPVNGAQTDAPASASTPANASARASSAPTAPATAIGKTAPTTDAAARTASIVVSGLPSDAELKIDGVVRSGRRLRVEPGRHVLTVAVGGRIARTDTLVLTRDEMRNWTPRLTTPPASTAGSTALKKPETSKPPATKPGATSGKSRVSECETAVSAQTWANALDACTKEANGGSASAKRQLALIYQQGRGVGRNDELAAQWFAAGAIGGDAESMYQYAIALDRGRGTKKDQSSALRWYTNAADAGHAAAQYAVGDAYERGKITAKKDKAHALHWFQLAAAQNYRDAADKVRNLSK